MNKRLVKTIKDAKKLHVVFAKDLSFETVFENNKVSVVNLEKKKCDYGN